MRKVPQPGVDPVGGNRSGGSGAVCARLYAAGGRIVHGDPRDHHQRAFRGRKRRHPPDARRVLHGHVHGRGAGPISTSSSTATGASTTTRRSSSRARPAGSRSSWCSRNQGSGDFTSNTLHGSWTTIGPTPVGRGNGTIDSVPGVGEPTKGRWTATEARRSRLGADSDRLRAGSSRNGAAQESNLPAVGYTTAPVLKLSTETSRSRENGARGGRVRQPARRSGGILSGLRRPRCAPFGGPRHRRRCPSREPDAT